MSGKVCWLWTFMGSMRYDLPANSKCLSLLDVSCMCENVSSVSQVPTIVSNRTVCNKLFVPPVRWRSLIVCCCYLCLRAIFRVILRKANSAAANLKAEQIFWRFKDINVWTFGPNLDLDPTALFWDFWVIFAMDTWYVTSVTIKSTRLIASS